jgi:hypothetical protein
MIASPGIVQDEIWRRAGLPAIPRLEAESRSFQEWLSVEIMIKTVPLVVGVPETKGVESHAEGKRVYRND